MQISFFPTVTATFPSTRYQGSKAKLVDWIWDHLAGLDFHSCLDAFGGTGVVSHRLKREGKAVTYNDILSFNYQFGVALIENNDVFLSAKDVNTILAVRPREQYPSFVQDTFQDVYFTDEENTFIDQAITNIQFLDGPYRRALAFFTLCQACIVKRPYNLFHRKNLYIRFAEVERSFGNKASWDKPFSEWMRQIASEANNAVFDGSAPCVALNKDVLELDPGYDLVYIDPPYTSAKGVSLDYADFYHFLEGLAQYEEWPKRIDWNSKHRRMTRIANLWTDKHRVRDVFDQLFQRFSDSTLVVSYRSDGIPSVEELVALLSRYKEEVIIHTYGTYKYVLSTNKKSAEVLIIAK